MSDSRTSPLSDEQVDRLIRRLDGSASIDERFGDRLLQSLQPQVRAARKRDTNRVRVWGFVVSTPELRGRSLLGMSRLWPVAALLAAALLAGILLLAGATHHVTPALQLGFRPVTVNPIHDPSNNSFASLLADGRVVVVRGGHVDVFDPTKGTYFSLRSPARTEPDLIAAATTMSALPDGRRLLTTDFDGTALLDPRSGALQTGPKLPASLGMFGYTATGLSDGRVLFAGGYVMTTDAAPPFVHHQRTFGAAALFDPATQSFVMVGSMSVRRHDYTATLLRDGRVLIAGGESVTNDQAQPVASAELFDPRTGTFSPTASLPEPRTRATAALLPDGRVLLVGGVADQLSQVSPASVIFDPATGSWSRTGSLQRPRVSPASVVLLDGRVLVMGGQNAFELIPGPTPDASADVEAELYDPATGTFSLTSRTGLQRSGASLVLLADGRVFVTSPRTDAPDELFGPIP
ncbi:MAG TPA: kelch repeat-containing protein [Candidatus Limnocylindrales bacterium]|nr:kelch repeat-containing protein [Candidatus Limnocylindrales bacterium]